MSLNNLKQLIADIKDFNIEKNIQEILILNKDFILNLLRTQMASGKDSKGNNTTIFGKDYYADRTIFDKEHGNYPALGKVTDRITNFLTGAFYSELQLSVNGPSFKVTSGVSYFDDIILRSGDSILKLSEQNSKILNEQIILPQLRERWKNFKK